MQIDQQLSAPPTSGVSTKKSEQVGKSFNCFFATKTSSLLNYMLQITETEVRIIASSSLKVKSAVALDALHIKNAQKEIRPKNIEDRETSAESATTPPTTIKTYLYPARIVLPDSKSRLAYFESRRERKTAVLAVLAAQGFRDQLD